jgi:hypothetical protein
MELVKNYKTENQDYIFIRNTLKKGYTHLNTILGLCRKVGMIEANRKITDLVKMGQIEQVEINDEDGNIKYKYFPKQGKPSYYSAAGIETLGGWQSDSVMKGRLTFDKLLNCVSKYYNVSKKDIIGVRRHRQKVICRQMFCYIARDNMPENSLESIGKALGGRDHSTVIHSINQATDLMTYDKKFKKDYLRLNEFIKTNL